MQLPDISAEVNALSEQVIGAAIEVHRVLGPGLTEAAYEVALVHELTLRNTPVERQVPLQIEYKGMALPPQRLDLVVGGMLVVELKAVDRVAEVHIAQMLSYVNAGGFELGLLLNFNERLMRDGIHRRANSRAKIRRPS